MRSNLYQLPKLYLVLGVIGLCTMSACNFGSGDETFAVQPIDIAVIVDESNVAALEGLTFTFSSGEAIHPGLEGDETTVTFTSESSIEIASGGNTATGELTFGSCIINIETSTFPPGEGPQVGDEIVIEPCAINIMTEETTDTGIAQSGTVTLILGATESDPVTVTIVIENAGNGRVNIFINNEIAAVARVTSGGGVTDPETPQGGTGATGTGGTGGGG